MAIDAPGVSPTVDRESGRFRRNVWLTWLLLFALLGVAFHGLHLDFSYVGQKLPFLLGLRLAPDGFIQGAALTILVTVCSMFFALLVALITALGRLSRIRSPSPSPRFTPRCSAVRR